MEFVRVPKSHRILANSVTARRFVERSKSRQRPVQQGHGLVARKSKRGYSKLCNKHNVSSSESLEPDAGFGTSCGPTQLSAVLNRTRRSDALPLAENFIADNEIDECFSNRPEDGTGSVNEVIRQQLTRNEPTYRSHPSRYRANRRSQEYLPEVHPYRFDR